MASKCLAGQYLHRLIRRCMHCDTECQQRPIPFQCRTYCESAECRAQPGHYYDSLLRSCMMCTEVCGSHPAECWQHCQTPLPPVVTGLEEPNLVLYPLLAITLVLLFSSLLLALVVLLRSPRILAANARSKEAKHDWECVVQLCKEDSPPAQCSGENSCQPTSYDLSDDSSPTETCVCVHCFPDLKTLSQGHDRPPRAPVPLYPYPALHRAHVRNGGPVLPEVAAPTSGGGTQPEFVVE